MDPQRWLAIQPLLEEALDLTDESRAAYLAGIRARDAPLADEVERLVAAADRTIPDNAIDACAGLFDGDGDAAEQDEARIGTVIGAFRLERLLGSGGMGAVYLAHRIDGDFTQRVAVKLLREHYSGANVRQRFNRERDLLAQLVHPNIAQLLDGGTTPEGTPYFTMEYVDGVPIHEYCRTHVDTVTGRLELLLQAARALSFAHQNLIIHRDIKPSNILVRSDGVVKLVDFGIAKVAQPTRGATLTQAQVGPMTPEYAAPEQFTGAAVSVLTDVYQFGVLAYYVLAGALPYRSDPSDPIAWAKAVTSGTPISVARVSARAVDTDLGYLRAIRRHGPDLDAILQKAMEKNPADRYPSMDACASDLLAVVEERPIQARRTPTSVLLWRIVRRHRWTAAGAVVAVALLLAATLIAVEFAWRANEARISAEAETRKAVLEAARAREANLIFEMIIADFDPAIGERRVTQQEMHHALLRKAQRRMAERESDPLVEARLLSTFAITQLQLGLDADAERAAREALQLFRSSPDSDFHSSLNAAAALMRSLAYQGRFDEAIEVADTTTRETPHDRPDIARRLFIAYYTRALAKLGIGDAGGAARDSSAGIALLARLSPGDLEALAYFLSGLADAAEEAGLYALSHRLMVRAHEQAEASVRKYRVLPPVLAQLARSDALVGEHERAIEHAKRALDASRALSGEDSIITAEELGQLGYVYWAAGLPRESLDTYEKALAAHRRIIPPRPIGVATVELHIGRAMLQLNDPSRALRECQSAHDRVLAIVGRRSPILDDALDCLAAGHLLNRDIPAAHRLAGEALALRTEQLGPRHPATLLSEYRLAAVEHAMGNTREATERVGRVAAEASRVYPSGNANYREMQAIARRLGANDAFNPPSSTPSPLETPYRSPRSRPDSFRAPPG